MKKIQELFLRSAINCHFKKTSLLIIDSSSNDLSSAETAGVVVGTMAGVGGKCCC